MIGRRKQSTESIEWPKPPTLAERFNIASATHGSALSTFESLASELFNAETTYWEVAREADDEINRLTALKLEACLNAERARDAGENILELVRSNRND